MNKIVLLGGGGHCKSVIDTIKKYGIYDEIAITDQTISAGTRIMGCEVVGSDEELVRLKQNGFESAFITVGMTNKSSLREFLAKKIDDLGFSIPTLIDSTAIISDSATIGKGSFVGKNVVINSEVVLGEHCIINTGAIIEHECIVRDFTHVSVNSVLCGSVKVGKGCLIGAGSVVLQSLCIGDNVVVGANSTVLNNIDNDDFVYGTVK